jgi:hypothetical protein
MRKYTRSRTARIVTALVVAGALFAIATAVEAAIPDPSGVIHGCYAKTSQGAVPAGSLRVVDTGFGQSCNANEGTVNWSQTGPKGPTGVAGPKGTTGPKGATGAQGPAGAGPAFANYPSEITMQPDDTRTVADVVLPVGKYTLSGQVHMVFTGDSLLRCSLESSSGTVHQMSDPFFTGFDTEVDPFAELTTPIIGDVTVTAPNTGVRVVCIAGGSDPIDNVQGALIATQVSSVTVQS